METDRRQVKVVFTEDGLGLDGTISRATDYFSTTTVVPTQLTSHIPIAGMIELWPGPGELDGLTTRCIID